MTTKANPKRIRMRKLPSRASKILSDILINNKGTNSDKQGHQICISHGHTTWLSQGLHISGYVEDN